MIIKILQKFKPSRWLVYQLLKAHGRDGADQITPMLKKKDKIIDIGSGSGHVCYELRQRGYNVQPVDVVNLSFVPDIVPELYDGKRLPYPDKTFDTALIMLVLHHTGNPESIIAEARRVARQIIIMEDIYNNWFDKYRTYILDSMLNLEFFGHPHSNRTDHAWRNYFEKQGFSLKHASYTKSFGGALKHATYVLET